MNWSVEVSRSYHEHYVVQYDDVLHNAHKPCTCLPALPEIDIFFFLKKDLHQPMQRGQYIPPTTRPQCGLEKHRGLKASNMPYHH